MPSEPTPYAPTELELVQARARANFLLALYAHADHDLQQSARQCERLRGELAHAHNEIQRLRDERVRDAARAEEQQQRYDALIASTSWRVTAPLRSLARLFGRGL